MQSQKDKSRNSGSCAALSFIAMALQKQYSTWITMLLFTHEEFLFTAQGPLQQLLL
jgi:hypothetical protein